MKEVLIDLRSDTVTRPTPAMRKAMAEAEVGDDVYQEDPTVNALEARAAEIVGKEAAIFVPTGTMGNTIAIKMHTRHGEEVICEAHSHVLDWELSMMAWFAGCLARPVETGDGILSWELIEKKLRKASPHNSGTSLITLENSHNMLGGRVYSIEAIDEICDRAHSAGIRVHMDGARLFNAAAATQVTADRIAKNVDSVMFCLSKGLRAPVGSILAGRRDDIDAARLYRKRLGGGMRQAGILAAAGLLALEERGRLVEDHANARLLAERLAVIPGIEVDPQKVQTNIIIARIDNAGLTGNELSDRLKARGVLANGVGATHIRFVTHADVNRAQCQHAADVVAEVTGSNKSIAVPTHH